MKKIWIKVFNNFKQAEKSDEDYYAKMTPVERLETMQFLRELAYKFKGEEHEGRTRLRRVIKIIQQK